MRTRSRQRVESSEVAVSPPKGKRGAEVEGLGEESILLNMARGENTGEKDKWTTGLGVAEGLLELGCWKDVRWCSEWDSAIEIVTGFAVGSHITGVAMAVRGRGKGEEH